MNYKTALFAAALSSASFSQVQVLSQGSVSAEQKQVKETVLEIVIDSSSVDAQIPIDLHQYLIHGTTRTANAQITYYSNEKVATLPATLNIPNGRYSFNCNNGQKAGRAGFAVDAEGGYQKWQITPGNSKVARKWKVGSRISFYSGLAVGGTLASIGHLRYGLAKSDLESAESSLESAKHMLEYSQDQLAKEKSSKYSSQSIIEMYQDDIKQYTNEISSAEESIAANQKKVDSTKGMLVAGYTILGAGVTIAIPTHIGFSKHRMKAKKLESRAGAPVKTLESQGVAQ